MSRRAFYPNDLKSWAMLSLLAIVLPSCESLPRAMTSGVLRESGGRVGIDLQAVRQAGRSDCGAACLVAVLAKWGCPVTEAAMAAELGPVPPGGYALSQLQGVARKRGFDAFILEGNAGSLGTHTALGRPLITPLAKDRDSNHCVVVTSLDSQMVEVMDPADGKIHWRNLRDFDRQWAALGRPYLLVGKGGG